MKLWILEARRDLPKNNNPWDPWFDKTFGVVARAETECEARQIAATECGEEGQKVWLTGEYTICEELTPDGETGCVIKDLATA